MKERAERDIKEREALESLKMRLEAEKRKVEDQLSAERDLGLSKDALLERSKNRELELSEEVAALQADLDSLDSQLDRAMKIHKESEEKHKALQEAFEQAAEHLVRLEEEQKEWEGRDEEINGLLKEARDEVEALRAEREELLKEGEELKALVRQKEEDLVRVKDRMEGAITDLEGKLAIELRNRYAFSSIPPSSVLTYMSL